MPKKPKVIGYDHLYDLRLRIRDHTAVYDLERDAAIKAALEHPTVEIAIINAVREEFSRRGIDPSRTVTPRLGVLYSDAGFGPISRKDYVRCG